MFEQSILSNCYGDCILFSVDLTHFKDLSKMSAAKLNPIIAVEITNFVFFYLILYYCAGQFYCERCHSWVLIIELAIA